MKIIHFSDWHASFTHELPPGDLYVCTGDMLPNFRWGIDHISETKYQHDWLVDHEYRSIIKNDTGQVVCVRGNHDFADLTPLFGQPCWEVTNDPARVFEFQGLRIGGWRGVNPISGRWSDEKSEAVSEHELKKLPDDLDILLTHQPPYQIMDYCGENVGCKALGMWVADHPKLKLHCFGHIHESPGILSQEETIFSNAACTTQIIEL